MCRELIFLTPIFHEKIWGGRKLETEFGYTLPQGSIGECWAISAHPHGDCCVRDGRYAGFTLSDLWRDHRELFGNAPQEQFPLLVKILDAKDRLSVQVHPDDTYAAVHEAGSLGKRESWYVLDADNDAHIVVGQHAKSRKEFESLVASGNWEKLLNTIPIQKGDFFPVEPGTLHAILEGTLILETQQSSDVTYRVYDFDRVDDMGYKRELHLQQALGVIDYAALPPTSGKISAPEVNGITQLMHCPSFDVVRLCVHNNAPVTLEQRWDFLCMSVVSGAGSVQALGVDYPLTKADHCVVPSGTGELLFTGEMKLICSYVQR